MKIFELLDEITDDVGDSRKSLFGRRTFDSDYVLTIVEAIRAVLPRDLAEAQKVLADREGILAEARTYATAIVEDAQARARKAVNDQKVMRTAMAQSDQIMADTRAEADAIRKAADDYAFSVLDDLAAYVSEYQTIIQENRGKYLERRNRQIRDARTRSEEN